MTITREQYVSDVRALAREPRVKFNHQGRTLEGGLDCAGTVVWPFIKHGIPFANQAVYGRTAYEDTFLHHFMSQMDVVEGGLANAKEGDVVLCWLDTSSKKAQHSAVLVKMPTGEWGIVHAFEPVGWVVEAHMGGWWKRRVIVVLRFKTSMVN